MIDREDIRFSLLGEASAIVLLLVVIVMLVAQLIGNIKLTNTHGG